MNFKILFISILVSYVGSFSFGQEYNYYGEGFVEFKNGIVLNGTLHARKYTYTTTCTDTDDVGTEYECEKTNTWYNIKSITDDKHREFSIKDVAKLRIGDYHFERVKNKMMRFNRKLGEAILYDDFSGENEAQVGFIRGTFKKYNYKVKSTEGSVIDLYNNIQWKKWIKNEIKIGAFPKAITPFFKHCKSPEEFIDLIEQYIE